MKIAFKRNALVLTSLAFIAGLACVPAIAAQTSVHVRGVVTAVNPRGFTVRTDSGSRSIKLESKTHIAGVVPGSLDNIKPGTFIGTANVKRHGTHRALEMVIFPPSMKGTGLGDYAWDLSPHGSHSGSAMTNGTVKSRGTMGHGASGHSMMTNGTVKSRSSMGHGASGHSTMTNGTVKKASHNGELKLVVNYGKGQKTIEVPAGVPVVKLQSADKGAIVKGAHVFVAGKAAGSGKPVHAALVAVGLHGTVPPM